MKRLPIWLLAALILSTLSMMTTSVLAVPVPTGTVMQFRIADLPEASLHPVHPDVRRAASSFTMPAPKQIWLVQDGDTWRAFANQSTHYGEPLEWQERVAWWRQAWQPWVPNGYLVDPISGSAYTRQGDSVAGPGVWALTSYPVKVTSDGNLLVDMGHPQKGRRSDGRR